MRHEMPVYSLNFKKAVFVGHHMTYIQSWVDFESGKRWPTGNPVENSSKKYMSYMTTSAQKLRVRMKLIMNYTYSFTLNMHVV